MSKFYRVTVREIYNSVQIVEADFKDEALYKIHNGEGLEIDTEFSHNLEPKFWIVEEISREEAIEEVADLDDDDEFIEGEYVEVD